jgi:hypothetical protein
MALGTTLSMAKASNMRRLRVTGRLSLSWVTGTATYSAWLDRRHDQPSTSSPTANSVTPSPTALTTPAQSLPFNLSPASLPR